MIIADRILVSGLQFVAQILSANLAFFCENADGSVNNFCNIISGFARLAAEISNQKAVRVTPTARTRHRPAAPLAMIFSPHPDDECITGGLALRLKREARMNVINVAVTLGSNPRRRMARLRELKNACAFLGFDLLVAGREALRDINLSSRRRRPSAWGESVKVIAAILDQSRPAVIFMPHANDGHGTHIGTHHLVMDALKRMPAGFHCCVVETEYWGQMAEPNLLVEIGVNELADLVAALSLHRGEVKRNAYHARLPGWMMDNVRRAEMVCQPGTRAPGFPFGAIYRVRWWKRRRLAEAWSGGRVLLRRNNAASIIPRLRSS